MTKPKSRLKAKTHSTARKTAKPASRKRSALASPRTVAKPETKHARMITILRSPAGAMIAALVAVTKWPLPRTTCCFHSALRRDVRPEQFERRARLVGAIARGRRWLDDVVSGRVGTVAELCAREKCSVRHVNMTISLAFLAPNLVKAAVEGRLPRGIGIERLRDPPNEWSRQFEALGLNPE